MMPSPSRCRAGGGYGWGADPGLRDGDGGPGAAGAERISGRREPVWSCVDAPVDARDLLTAPAIIGCGHVPGPRSAALSHAAGRYGDTQTRRRSKTRALSSLTIIAFPGLDLSDQFPLTVSQLPSLPTHIRKSLLIIPAPQLTFVMLHTY